MDQNLKESNKFPCKKKPSNSQAQQNLTTPDDNCHHASIFLGYLSFGLPIIIGSKTYHRALTHQDLKDETAVAALMG